VALKRRAGALSSSLGPFLILMHPSGLAAKHSEKDRYVRPYAQGHTSEELETYLLDLNHQIDNLRLLIESAQADLSRSAEKELAAKDTEAWLLTVRNRIAEVEEDTDEAFKKRRELAKLLVERIDVGREENGRPRARITYRFGPPRPTTGAQDARAEEDTFVAGEPNSTAKIAAKPARSTAPSPPHTILPTAFSNTSTLLFRRPVHSTYPTRSLSPARHKIFTNPATREPPGSFPRACASLLSCRRGGGGVVRHPAQ